MDKHLTFEKLPQEVSNLSKEFAELKKLILESKELPKEVKEEKLLTVKGAAKLLDLTVPTIYSKISRKELPFMKRSGRVYFSRTDLLNYLKEGRVSTLDELKNNADQYLSNKKGLNYGK
tara:strand:- start:315 stop:671 length:357 start_codon:yes stop_codon:yes gene_type:complete